MTAVTSGVSGAPPARADPALAPLPAAGLVRAAWRLNRTVLLGALGAFGLAALALALALARLQNGNALPNSDLYRSARYVIALQWLPLGAGAIAGATVGHRAAARRTACFTWTQGVSRVRWAAAQLAVASAPLAAAAALVGLVFGWWYAAYTWPRAGIGIPAGQMFGPAFGLYAPMAAGWLLASFALSALLAVLVRSAAVPAVLTLIASGATFPYNAGSRLAWHVLPVTGPAPSMPPGSTLIEQYYRLAGAAPAPAAWRAFWRLSDPRAAQRWLAAHHVRAIAVYQPPGRFWALEFAGFGVLALLALLCGAATVWLIRRRSV